MTLYEVNIRVLSETAHSFSIWLEEHIREIIRLDGFLSAEWFEVEEDTEAKELEEAVRQAVRLDESIPHELREAAASPVSTRSFVIHYRLRDRESLENYFTNHAPRLREDGLEKFGDQFTATRRVMDKLIDFVRDV